jgi:NAD(P)-dependent dehydrogenase (short-subunit alcohol dehydrogenase family)
MALLDGKTAIITGAAGGIGAATARLMVERGASVLLADINLVAAREIATQIDRTGRLARAVYLDLAEEAAIESVVRECVQQFGKIDILHNNAADLSRDNAGRDHDIENMDTEVWDRTFRVNLRGTMLCCKHALPHMVKRGTGSIVNTGSNLGLQGHIVQAAYAASKAAVMQLTRSIAASHGRRGIRCNTVSPGLVMTPVARDHLPRRLHDIVAGETLTPYLGISEDIAHAVIFLASDESRYVTGHNLIVDGGTVSHVPGFAQFAALFTPHD